jgi:capsular polysaccharide biosynthesis protein
MYGPKESEQRQTPRPVGQGRGARAAADFVVGSDGTAAVAEKSPLARLGQLGRVGVDDVLTWLRDGIGWIIGAIIVCLVGALLYAVVTPPRYTVYTDILIDPSNLNVVRDDVFTSNPQRDAQLLEVESKLRILTSRNVLSRVIDKLDLTNDPEFVKPGLLAPLWNLISPAEVARDNRLAVMRALSERVDARREERSFVVVMRFWAEEPEKAVTISNAIVDAFEAELFQSSAESAGRVVKNLNNRLDELRRNVTEAEQRVEDFRRSKGLQLNNGEPVSARLSSELNTQVLDAQQRFIQAETRYRQMSAAIAERRTTSAAIFARSSTSSSSRSVRSGRRSERGTRRWSRPCPSSRRSRPPWCARLGASLMARGRSSSGSARTSRHCAARRVTRSRTSSATMRSRSSCATSSAMHGPRPRSTRPISPAPSRSASASRSTPAMSA